MAWWGLSSLLYNPHVKQYADRIGADHPFGIYRFLSPSFMLQTPDITCYSLAS
jgi:hypothetical protein